MDAGGFVGRALFSVHKSSAHFPHPDEACKPSSSSRPICPFILTQLRLSVRSGRLSRLLGTGGVEQHPALPWGFMPCLAAKQKKKKTPTDRFPCVFVWVGGGRGARCGRHPVERSRDSPCRRAISSGNNSFADSREETWSRCEHWRRRRIPYSSTEALERRQRSPA